MRRISTAGSAASSDTSDSSASVAALATTDADTRRTRLAISADLGNTVGMRFLVVIIC